MISNNDADQQHQPNKSSSSNKSILAGFPCGTAAEIQSPGGNGSSTASSRDTSPCRDLSPLVTNLKPPIIIRRGPRGFGFTVHTIRVYYGDTDFYTMHHLVMAVDDGSPAFEAGLRPADLITHVNGEPVQGLYHTQVLQLLLSGSEHVTLRATPLESTSIQSGGRKRELWQSKLAKKSTNRQRKQKKDNDKKRKTSLFRRISSKRASAEMQQLAAGGGGVQSPTMVTPSRSFQSFTRSESLNTPPTNRISLSPLDSFTHQQSNSNSSQSASSSPSSSAPNTPTTSTTPMYPRPSTLHGLKHKLHTQTAVKTLHANNQNSGPNRRKSVGHIPLSPLARTPSPSPLPASPTRSPSPLLKATHFPPGHSTGASNTTQAYVPGTTTIATGAVAKKSFARPKSAEPSSPLLRRALSPDRLHPRTAENKIVVSPLCCNAPIKTNQRPVSGIWRSGSATVIGSNNGGNGGQYTTSTKLSEKITEHEDENEEDSPTSLTAPSLPLPLPPTSSSQINQSLSLSLQAPGEMLPRIAEEKDSPTGGQEDSDRDQQKTIIPLPSATLTTTTKATIADQKPSTIKRIERRKSPEQRRSGSGERKLSLADRKSPDERASSAESDAKSDIKVSVKEQVQKLDRKASTNNSIKGDNRRNSLTYQKSIERLDDKQSGAVKAKSTSPSPPPPSTTSSTSISTANASNSGNSNQNTGVTKN